MSQLLSVKLAIIDVDGTLVNGQVQQILVEYFFKKGRLSLWYAIRLKLWFILYNHGIVSDLRRIFEFGLIYLKDKPIRDIDTLVDGCIREVIVHRIFTESFNIIQSLRDDGFRIIILSTAIDTLISRISKIFDADDYVCTRLETKGEFYTGNILGELVYGVNKLAALENYIARGSYSVKKLIAYADHESDIALLKAADRAFIVNPNKRMRDLAQRENIGIIYVQ